MSIEANVEDQLVRVVYGPEYACGMTLYRTSSSKGRGKRDADADPYGSTNLRVTELPWSR